MKLSTQTIIVLGLVQCIILTLVLILFMRYQRSLESTTVPGVSEVPSIRP